MTIDVPARPATRVGPPRPYPPRQRRGTRAPERGIAALPERPRPYLPGDGAGNGQYASAVSLLHPTRHARGTERARTRERVEAIVRTSLWAAPLAVGLDIAAYYLLHTAGITHLKIDTALFMLASVAVAAHVGAVMAWRELRTNR